MRGEGVWEEGYSVAMSRVKMRVRLLLPLLLLAYFLLGYFLVGFLPHYASFEAGTFVDGLVPLVPFFIVFYFSTYLFVSVPMFVIRDRREYFRVAKYYFLILSVSFLLFLAVPIELKKELVIPDGIFSQLTVLVHQFDTDFNNFPSLHVALSLFAFLFVRSKSGRLAWFLFPFLILVILSTLFVKQHVVVDVMGGAVLAFVFYWFYCKCKPAERNLCDTFKYLQSHL